LFFALVGYLAGSIPTGYWLVRLLRHEDIRRVGSGNIGATNVWRTYGARYGVPVMLADTLKGFVPALLATHYAGPLAGVLAGGAAMLGHWRPLFMGFARGGKAVATCGGAFLAVAPVVGGIGLLVWIATFALFRYASVASIVAALSLPVAAVLLHEPWPVIAFATLAALAVLVLHRPNISRLRAGTETRFRFRRQSQTPTKRPATR
jgi:glycerol-3-phosphate acyltransferase PlsY